MNQELLENPADLLREVRENFIIKQDIESLSRIDGKIQELHNIIQNKTDLKNIEITKLNVDVNSRDVKTKELQSDLEEIRAESQDLNSHDEITDYVKEFDKLEEEIVTLRAQLDNRISKFVNKEIKSSESIRPIDMDGLEQSEIEKVGDFKEILDDPIAQANILKLKLYRSLGVIIDDSNTRAIIETTGRKIDTLPLDDGLSGFFKTKYIWERIERREMK